MKLLRYIVAYSTLVVFTVYNIPIDCTCKTGYVPKTDENGSTHCHGIANNDLAPCGISFQPCQCTNSTGVLYDEAGRWCVNFVNGSETDRWHCENED